MPKSLSVALGLAASGKTQHSALQKLNHRAVLVKPWIDAIRLRLVQVAGRLRQARERWHAYDVYIAALLIFAASRFVVLVGANFGNLLVFIPARWETGNVPIPAPWDAGHAWYHRLLRWDAGWYAAIVRDGYQYSDDPTVPTSIVFYPLYPLVSLAVQSLLGTDEWVALLIVANVASLVAVILMTKLVKDELGDEAALLSLAFFCFHPASLFLSAGFTESLCLVFVLLSFILLTQEKFVLAAMMAGISLGARSTGIVMIPVILWEMWRRNTLPWQRLLPRMALCGILAASGLLVFMAYLGFKFGPFAFATGQARWYHGTFLDRFVSALMLAPFQYLNIKSATWFVCYLGLTIWSFGRLRPSLSLYALGVLMLPYFTLGIPGPINRYLLLGFPAFMCLGILCKGRPWLGYALIGIFAALLLQNTALFSQWYWVG